MLLTGIRQFPGSNPPENFDTEDRKILPFGEGGGFPVTIPVKVSSYLPNFEHSSKFLTLTTFEEYRCILQLIRKFFA